jgi:oxalate---CoA ligase
MRWPIETFGGLHDLKRGIAWSSADLVAAVEEGVVSLKRAGVRTGDVVAIAATNSAEFFSHLFALWQLGATATCLDPGLAKTELKNVLAWLCPRAVLRDGEVHYHNNGPPRTSGGVLNALDRPAVILFTSGTTNVPKGVVLSHRALLARTAMNRAAIGDLPLQRSLVTLVTHFGHGLIGSALTPLTAGCDVVLCAPEMAIAPRLGPTIDEHSITFLASVPSFWRVALKLSAPPKRQTLRRVHVGSAPLSSDLWIKIAEWCRCEVVNCYGCTEAANWIAGASSNHRIEDNLVGKPWGGTAFVLGEDGTMRRQGSGEILIQTPSLMTEYFQRSDLTEAALHEGWYRTGDHGYIAADGTIRLQGRLGDEINRAGLKVHPGEIDWLLEKHSAVTDVCTFGLADAVSGEIIAAAVRLREGASETAFSLRAWCLKRIRREAVPERWFFVDQIARTSRGKLDRAAVRDAVLNRTMSE